MPVTSHELERFHDYVQSRLGQPQPPESLQECLDQWRRDQEEALVVDHVQHALAEIETGGGISLNDATALLQADLSWFGRRS